MPTLPLKPLVWLKRTCGWCNVAIVLLLTGCASSVNKQEARSSYGAIFSPAMNKEMQYGVYTPPGWTRDEQLPLVVLLHGARDDETTFDRYGISEYLDEQYANSLIPRAIILNPNGNLGFWENWKDGSYKYRDWVMDDLLPVVQQRYNTLACPEHCHVSGISMGAHGALRFAYYEPYAFDSVGAISGLIITKQREFKPNLFQRVMLWFIPTKRIWGDINASGNEPEDLDPYIGWTQKPSLLDTRLRLSWNRDEGEGIKDSNSDFHSFLAKNNRAHEVAVMEGEHLWVHWKSHIAANLRFHIWGSGDAIGPPP